MEKVILEILKVIPIHTWYNISNDSEKLELSSEEYYAKTITIKYITREVNFGEVTLELFKIVIRDVNNIFYEDAFSSTLNPFSVESRIFRQCNKIWKKYKKRAKQQEFDNALFPIVRFLECIKACKSK